VDTTSGDAQQRQEGVTPARARVFINYRRDDTAFQARLIYDRLASRFGRENVFLDVHRIQSGAEWLEEIKSHGDSCLIFLSLIGPHWMSIMTARDQAGVVSPGADWVQYEIQRALRPNSGIRVIPVLVGDNVPFKAEELPRPLRALAELQVAHVRELHFESEIELLIIRLEAIAREQRGQPVISPEPVPVREEEGHPAPDPARAAHYEDVVRQMMDEGSVVPFLGPRIAASRSSAVEGTSSLPDAEALAAALAERFGIAQARLPQIAQYVYVTRGWPDLYRMLSRLLTADYEPGPVHRFLARFPGTLERLGLEKRYQLIVSTNFDTALEKAFDDEREPYDLAVYMASGPDKGKFVHFPSQGAPSPINEPNSYTSFPIGLDYELKRTLIVKIHGAVDGNVGDYRWRGNYVITEDHYIDYLSNSPIESLVPVQVLGKLRESHCLFLGYTVRDWNLRVFLKRIWEGSLSAKSWAIDPDPAPLEKEIWAKSGVDLYAADLGHYVGLLQGLLSARTPEIAEL
jgi:hypothetical protein